MSLNALRSFLPWKKRDPYEDFYLSAAVADPRNLIVNRLREAPEGGVFAVKAETHTPAVMARHVKELGRFFGADLVRIAATNRLAENDRLVGQPFVIVCGFRAEHDPRDAPGIGGHAAALKGAFATFQIGAIIREYGFHATRAGSVDAERVAAAAGAGTVDASGRLCVPRFGTHVHIAEPIFTDLPVEPD